MKDYPLKLCIDSSLLYDEAINFKQFLTHTCSITDNCELSVQSENQNSVVFLKEKNAAGDLIRAFQNKYSNNINITYINSENEVIVKLSN